MEGQDLHYWFIEVEPRLSPWSNRQLCLWLLRWACAQVELVLHWRQYNPQAINNTRYVIAIQQMMKPSCLHTAETHGVKYTTHAR